MGRADIAQSPSLPTVQTISPPSREEGPAFDAAHRLLRRSGATSHRLTADQSLQGHVFRQTSHGVVLELTARSEFTVISRFLDRVATISPQFEVPNHAVAVNASA